MGKHKKEGGKYNFIIAASDLSFTVRADRYHLTGKAKLEKESWLIVEPIIQGKDDSKENDDYCPIIPLIYFKTTPDEFQKCFPEKTEASTFYEVLGFPNDYAPFRIYDANRDSDENKSPFTFYDNILNDRNVRVVSQNHKWENATVIPGWSQGSQSLGSNPMGNCDIIEKGKPLDLSSANPEALPINFGYNLEPPSNSTGFCCWPGTAKKDNLFNRKVVKITETGVRYTGKNVPMIKITLNSAQCAPMYDPKGKTKIRPGLRKEIFVDMAHHRCEKEGDYLKFVPTCSFTDSWYRIVYLQFQNTAAAKVFKKRLENPSS